jgi:hypothetical protein
MPEGLRPVGVTIDAAVRLVLFAATLAVALALILGRPDDGPD